MTDDMFRAYVKWRHAAPPRGMSEPYIWQEDGLWVAADKVYDTAASGPTEKHALDRLRIALEADHFFADAAGTAVPLLSDDVRAKYDARAALTREAGK